MRSVRLHNRLYQAGLRSREVGSAGEDLLRRASAGDQEALVRLLEQHTPAIGKWVAGKIPGCWRAVLSAEDVMQQTFADAFLNIGRFVPHCEESFAAWLFTIARRNLLNALEMLEAEKRGKGRRGLQRFDREESLVALYELLSAGSTTPSRDVARNEACAILEHAIERLPEAYRRAVQMYDLESRPMDEVARALQRSPGAVHMIRARAYRRLQAIMGSVSKYLTTA